MSNKKIDILMATYNGEKYIEEQINSIISQTYTDWNLLIRDDKSSDRTVKKLEELEKKDSRIKIIRDRKGNLGIVKNFEELLNNSKEDYVMFSDQDDIWNEDKLDIYINKINEVKKKDISDFIFLMHSNAVLNNGKSFIQKKFLKNNFNNLFFNYFVQGATVLITKEFKEFILPFPKEAYIHDRYFHLVSDFFFDRIFLDERTMFYRQHDNNQIGAKNDLKRLLSKQFFESRDRQLIELLYKRYKNRLSKEKTDKINDYLFITDRKKNRFKRFMKLKKSKIYMPIKKQIFLLLKG